MVTTSSIVEQIIREKPFLEDALVRGIINYSALAEELAPEVKRIKESIDGEEVEDPSISSVMMALRRIAERLKQTFHGTIKDKILFDDSDNRIIYDLFEMTVRREAGIVEKIEKIYGFIDLPGGDFLTITHGLYEITIISNKRYRDKIKTMFTEDEVQAYIPELASLSIKIPETAINTEGLFYLVTKTLFLEGISIVELVSTYTEMIFILKEYDIPKATTTIRSLISSYSKV